MVAMKCSKKEQLSAAVILRSQAEKRLQVEAGKRPDAPEAREEDLLRLVHELKVHHVELEMQNAELCRIRDELELERDKYAELYDFAPVAYFAFDGDGVIREVNFAGAQLLGLEKRQLLNKPFVGFIVDTAGKDVFLNHLNRLAQKQIVQRCEVSFRSNNGRVIPGQFQSIAVHNPEHHDDDIFTSITDVTVYRQLEAMMHREYDSLELTVHERTEELIKANERLSHEIEDRKVAANSLREALTIIKQLKEQLREENLYLREEIDQIYSHSNFVGDSKAIRAALKQVGQVAPTEATVLI